MEIRAGWARGFERVHFQPPAPRDSAGRRRKGPARFVLAVGALAVCLAAPVGLKAASLGPAGVSFSVTSTTDAVDASPGNGACATSAGTCTLRAAIQETNALAGTDTIVLPAGTYELAIAPLNQNLADVGDLDITDSLTISGAGASSTILDGGSPPPGAPVKVRGLDRLFEVTADGGTVTISGVTLSDGYAAEYGGALMNNSTATVTVTDSALTGNVAEKAGGGIDNHLGGTLEVEDSMLSNNVSFESGSALNNQRDGTLTISSTTVTSNSATDLGLDETVLGAGAIANNAELDARGTITVTGSSISDNTAGGSRSGAALSNDGTGTVVVRTTTFSKNRAKVDGGAIFNGAGEVTVENSTFSENAGESGGAISNGTKDGRLTVSGSTFSLNDAAARGGAIASGGTGHLEVSDSTFSKNTAEGWGGAVVNDDKGSVTIRSCTFTENSGLNGGGFGNEGDGPVLVESSTFTKNAAFVTAVLASGEGGGLHSNSSGELVVTGGLFSENRARSGGGLGNEGGGQLTITRTRFTGNRADEKGGGILIQSGTVRMVDLDVLGNFADAEIEGGGGIAYEGDKLVSVGEAAAIESSRIRGNKAKGQGGGIDSRGDGPLDIATTTIEGNTAAMGGGIHHVGDAPLDVIRSTLSGNSAENGGGLFTDGDGETTVVNSTVSGNRAGQFGGGLLVSSRLYLRSATVSANVASAGGGVNNGGGDLVGDGTVFLANTIVSGNTGGNCAGTMVSHGGNVEGANTCQLFALTDQPGTDPRLGALAANGGPTDTHALLEGSPAQDKAACTEVDPCPEVDQRGIARPAFGGYDAGAYESSLEPLGGGGGGGQCTGRTERPVPSDRDSWISEAAVGSNFGGDSTLKVASQAGGNQRALLHFELPAIPPGCRLVDATLRLYSPSAVDGRTIDVLRITSDWSESTVTWSNQPLTDGGASGAASGLDVRQWDVLAQTLDMYSLGGHGFLVRDRTEDESSALQSFHSREKGADRPPELVLVFDDPNAPPAGGDCASTPLRLFADRDSWVSESSPTNNFGTDSTLKIKSQVGSNSRLLIRFPLPELSGSCTSVASATMRMEATSAKEGRTLVARLAGEAWTESAVTWANQPAGAGPAVAIPSFDGPLEWDVTAGVLQMYMSANDGLVVRDADENGVGDEQTINSRHKITDAPPELLLIFDSSTPETSIGLAPLSPTDEAGATFTFSSDRPDASFECALDGGSFQACTSPKSYAALGEGAHSFRVRATRPVRAVDTTPASHVWTISIPPETTIDSGPGGLTNNATPQLTFSSEPGATFECALDGDTFTGCSSPYVTTALAEGAHTFEVRAVDSLGNVDPTPAERGFTVDTSAPETTIVSGPSGLTAEKSAVLAFSASEGGVFECALDAAAYASCTSPVSLAGLADGPHTFQVRASDAAGNMDATPASHTWTVDTTAPETTIDSGPSGLTNDATPELAFSSEAGASFECSLDAAEFAACESPHAVAALTDGDHTFAVRAVDAVGNADATPASRSFSVDTSAPQTTITEAPEALTGDNTPTFAFSSGEATATFECRVDANPFASCSSPHTTGALADGAHGFEVRARDAAGNTDATPASRAFAIDTAAPETSIDSGPSGLTSATIAILAFSSTEAATFECALDAAAFASCTSPVSLAGLADGAHTFQVRASDAAGNTDSSPASRSWTVDTTAPETTIDSGPSGLTNDATPELTFSSEAGARFECSLDAAAFAACASPLTTPPLLDGAHSFAVRAVDGAGNADETPATRSFSVDTAAPETVIVAGPSALTTDSTPTFEFAGEAGATFQCSLDAGAFTSCASPLTTAALTDGSHTFEVRAVDGAGNADGTPAGRDFTVDTSAPDTTIDSGVSGLTSSASASFTFSASEAATFECALDAGDFVACTSPQGYAALSDGAHTFQVRATDAAGNADTSPAGNSWTVDTTAPETAIQAGPAGLTGDPTPTFEFATTDAGGGFECSLDAAAFAACTSPLTTAVLVDGAHTFEVRAVDEAGNADATPASRSFTVDATAPETTIDSGPSGPTSDSTPTFAFASEAGATFECSIDSGLFAACTSPVTTAALPDGGHTFEVRAVDAAGNVDATPASRAFTVDASAPETTIDSGPSGSTIAASASFTFSASEASTFECALDAGGFAACTSPTAYSGLGDGSHTFRVRATDAAGNTDATAASRTWTIDTAAPDTAIDSGPEGTTDDSTPTFEFSSEAGASFECRMDEGLFASCSSPHTTDALSDGAHTFEVRARDTAGNQDSSPASRLFTVDTTAPDTTIDSGPSGVTSDSTPTFTFSSDAGATFECRLDGGPFGACSSPHTTASLADGAHIFDVRARDEVGNVDGSPASRPFTVDATAPETTIDSGPSGPTNDATPTFVFSSNQAATFECRVGAAAFTDCTSPHTTAALADGARTFDVRARDTAGNVDATPAGRSFTVDTGVPAITLAGPPAQTSSTAAQLTFSANESVTGFRCALDTAALASCTSPVSLMGLALGSHSFRVEATDAAGNTGSATHDWTIVPPPDTTAPAISLAGPPAETTATTAQMTFSANEAVTGFRCALDTAALASCTSPVNLANLSLGQHSFRVEANDGAGNLGSATHVWSVMVAPDTTAPVVTISGPPASTPGTTATFTFTSDEPAAFRCSLDSGAYANCASGVSYSGLSLGQHIFQVEATDAAQNQSVTAYAWTIVDSSAPVVTITNGPTSPTSSTTATFIFSANEPVTFRCSLDSGALANCASGVSYSGLAVGQHLFEVRGTDGAGNIGSASYSWSVTTAPDTTAPVVTITQAPPSGTTSSTAQFAFSANEAATFRCSIDSGPLVDCVSGVTYSGLGQGAHLFQVQGRDMAGNIGAANWGWTIASQPPPPTGCTAQTLNLASNADTWVLESSPTSNYGRDSVIKVDTKSGANARVLVSFPLPASVTSCTIVDARLRLYAGSYKTGRTLLALPIGTSWNQTSVTWSSQPAPTGPSVSAPSGPGYVEWDVKSLMPASANAGFLVKDAAENGDGVEQGFHSLEKGADNPPVLIVTVG